MTEPDARRRVIHRPTGRAMPRVFWALLVSFLALWLVMNLGTAPRIEAMSDGLRLLDMRVTGYSFEDVKSFVDAIGEEGRAYYLNVQLPLDMVLPPLMAAVLFFVYRWLFRGRVGLMIGVGCLTSVIFDYLENAALAAVLRAGSDGLTTEMVAAANRWTTAKWGLALFGLALLVIGIVLRLRAATQGRELKR